MEIGSPSCELCAQPGGTILWQSAACRVIRVADPHYPGFCRVIWNDHVREMTDLDPAARNHLMQVVFAVEAVVRQLFSPHKINLASFGNMVPHVHWHIIPRWQDRPMKGHGHAPMADMEVLKALAAKIAAVLD